MFSTKYVMKRALMMHGSNFKFYMKDPALLMEVITLRRWWLWFILEQKKYIQEEQNVYLEQNHAN